MKNKVNLWGTHGATILGISLVLFMLGLLLTLEYHSYRLTHDAQERITYKVDLSPDVSDSLALALKDEIAQMEVVKHVDYISKEQAAKIFTQELDEDFVDFAGYNPLYPSLMVNFNVALLPDNSTETLDAFCAEMRTHDFVTGVAYQENVVNELRDIFYKLSWFLIVFVALLLGITIVLISSLIRIALFSRRDTIATMRLVYRHHPLDFQQPVRRRFARRNAPAMVWTDSRSRCPRGNHHLLPRHHRHRAPLHKKT